MQDNLDKVDWSVLSKNPNAINILENNKDKICWYNIAKNPNAIHLIKDRVEYEKQLNTDEMEYYLTTGRRLLSWSLLSENPNAIKILENNQDKINWYRLSSNSSIFEDEPIPL